MDLRIPSFAEYIQLQASRGGDTAAGSEAPKNALIKRIYTTRVRRDGRSPSAQLPSSCRGCSPSSRAEHC